MPKFGLIGKNIDYSFSKKYFEAKFTDVLFEKYSYENFDIQSITEFPAILKNNPDLKGLNVTIPYKEEIIPYLDKLSKKAETIGAVNVIRFTKKGNLKGYNSDIYGFKKSIETLLQPHYKRALILGTGGAAKAVAFALSELNIGYAFVSRNPNDDAIGYNKINSTTFDDYQIIINCTPIGTFPDIKNAPELPYQYFTEKHLAYDLIYNPEETEFLKRAKKYGATIKNGFEMLQFQAEKSWEIWNRSVI